VPENHQWVYVGDSGSDVYTFWHTCEELGYDFVLRVAQDRDVKLPEEDGEATLDQKHLKTLARALPAMDAHMVSIAAQHHQPKRDALLQMSFREVRVQPPVHGASVRKTALTAWVVRVWEPWPPEGQEPLEWILLSTLPIRDAQLRLGDGAMVWLALASAKISRRRSKPVAGWNGTMCRAWTPCGDCLRS
jgi:hypothetical protein